MRLEAMSWEDALEKASMELKLPKDAIAVEEISKPEKKIMGLKKIPGVYEVQERVKEENESTRQADRNGTVEVKNGQILVKDPMENGHEATLYIRQDQLIVKVNGETVTGNRTLKKIPLK